jgi:hypothetical protein
MGTHTMSIRFGLKTRCDTGHANYITVEEIPVGKEVFASTYYLHEHPIVILFDSGASHMSQPCAQKTNLYLEKMEVPYVIFTPRGRMVADHMVRKIPLELVGQIFLTNLLILEGQVIDIILGMRWMKMHKAFLDISARLVHQDSPTSGKVTLHLPIVPRLQASIHAIICLSCLIFRHLFMPSSACHASSSSICSRRHCEEPGGDSSCSRIS